MENAINEKNIYKNIIKNKLLFNDNNDKLSYYSSFGKYTLAKGNVTNLHINNLPVIILNLAPKFNIPSEKEKETEDILNYIISESNILPYVTYVYKQNIIKKVSIEENEECYNVIFNITKELEYIINKFSKINNNIVIVNLGRFSEYNYIYNMLNFCNFNNNYINIHNIHNKHISYFIKQEGGFNKESKTLKKDINRIKKKINSLLN